MPVLVSATTVTSQQIQMFQSLSPAQQNALIQQLQGGKGAVRQSNWQNEGETNVPRVQASQNEVLDGEEGGQQELSSSEPITESDADSQIQVHEESELKLFGYELFSSPPSTFAPVTDIPIPSEYIVGPGDELRVQIFGKENLDYALVVSRDGTLNFPGVGVISVAGTRFDEVKKQLIQRVKKQFIGVQAHVSMGMLRTIRVFVMGNVRQPGSYTVSSLSTLTNALFASGGVTSIGSLRRIELKRNGKVISEFDLYDLLLNGDTSADRRLLPGDVIFVPSVGSTVAVDGAVIRPAIYELKDENSVGDVLGFAGGFKADAYPQLSQILRVGAGSGESNLITIDLSKQDGLNFPIVDGDSLKIGSIINKVENVVKLNGHVERPGKYQWFEGMRVSDLIGSIDELQPQADLRYALIRREVGAERNISVVHVSLADVFAMPGSDVDIRLHERDSLFVFGLYGERNALIDPLVDQLKSQGRLDVPERVVNLKGNVRYPGVYPLTDGMRLSDLVEATVDVLPETDLTYVLIQSELGAGRILDLRSYNLSNDGDVDPLLRARDTVYFFSKKDERQDQLAALLERLEKQAAYGAPLRVVKAIGRVRHPGSYPLEKGMRLSDLIRAAGGLQESAYSLDAEISRYRVEKGMARDVEHLSINLAAVLEGSETDDMELESHDFLTIKELPNWRDNQTIELMGEVNFPGIYPIREGDTLLDVIRRAGGLTERAYPQAAIFTREELRLKEQHNLNELRERLQAELAAINLEQMSEGTMSATPAAVSAANDLASRLESTKALGRLVIDLGAIIDGDKTKNVVLKPGDMLMVPGYKQEVSILGEVFYPTSHLYSGEISVSDYVNMSGGVTKRADESRIYIVRANGAVMKAGSGWFSSSVDLHPGDTIVVPLDVDYLSSLRLWTNVSQIVYQLGVAVASWNAVGLF